MSIDNSIESKKKGRVKYFFKGIGRFIKGHVLLCVVLIVLIGVGIFFGKGYLAKKKMQSIMEDVGTLTTQVEKMDLQKSVSVTGTLSAGQSKSVTSTVATGTKVAAVNYEVGDYVEEGTVVVEFDADDYNTKLAQLNAKYNISDKKNAKELQSYLDQIEDYNEKIEETNEDITETEEWLEKYKIYYEDVKQAYDNWLNYKNESEKERYEAQNKVIKDTYDFTMEDYEKKQDSLKELKNQIKDYQDKIEEAQYNYEVAQLQQSYDNTYTKGEEYDKVTDSQSGTQVVAPISGYITAINVTAGNNYTQGNTVFTISNTDSFVVDASVDEYDIASLKEGLEAVVKFDATDDDEFTGKVTYVAVTSDSTTSSSSGGQSAGMGSSSSSASYEVKITLDGADERLRVGMTAKASVILESAKDCFALPYDCVETDKDGNSYVTEVADDETETKIPVTLGLESDYYVQIISDKLSEGMKVKATASSGKSSNGSSEDGQFPGGDFPGGGPGGDFGGGAPGGGGFGGGPGGGF